MCIQCAFHPAAQCTNPLSPRRGEGCGAPSGAARRDGWSEYKTVSGPRPRRPTEFLEIGKTPTFWSMRKKGFRRLTLARFAEITAMAAKAAEVERERKAARRAAISRKNVRKALRGVQRKAADRRMTRRAQTEAARRDSPHWLPRKRLTDAPGWRVLADRMAGEPGRWWATQELYDVMPEYRPKSVRAWLYRPDNGLLAQGLAVRAPNADFDAARHDRRQTEPRWLYRSAIPAAGSGAGGPEAGRPVGE